MFHKITLAAFLALVVLTAPSCSEAPKEEAPEPVAEKPPEPEGPFYELTKEEILDHPDWTSRNITFMGVKLGDKMKQVEKNFGTLDATEPMGDVHYRSIYEKVSYSIYTQKMTNDVEKIEIYSKAADKIKDPKLRKLLSSGDLEYMRQILGPEEGQDLNPVTTGSESIYDSKGFRFVKYELPGNIKFNALLFAKMPKK